MKYCHYYNKKEGNYIDKKFMSLKEVCEYTGWGQKKVRQILNKTNNKYTIRLGNRLYVDKELFDDYLKRFIKYQISL